MLGTSPKNSAGRVDLHRPRVDGGACRNRRAADVGVHSIQFGERPMRCKRSSYGALRIVLLSGRIAKQRHQPAPELLGDLPAHLCYCRRDDIEIRVNQIAPLLDIETGPIVGRIDQIAKHHNDVVVLAKLFRNPYRLFCCTRMSGRRLGHQHCRLWRNIKLGDRTQHFATITKDNAEILEILIYQVREDGEIDTVFSKALRILGHAKLFEPLSETVHDTATKIVIPSIRAKGESLAAFLR
jgi:hypothetical protein